jgi:hypothetical protein
LRSGIGVCTAGAFISFAMLLLTSFLHEFTMLLRSQSFVLSRKKRAEAYHG